MLPTMPDKIERDADPLDGPISLNCTRKHAMISGFGAYISPKPNRLVPSRGDLGTLQIELTSMQENPSGAPSPDLFISMRIRQEGSRRKA